MLATQIQYWQNVEISRHNRATEDTANRDLAERARHNVLTERLGYFNYAETAKHNRATERIQRDNVRLGYQNLSEAIRSHKASEAINWANARSKQQEVGVKAMQVGYENANTQYANRTNRMNAYTNEANATIRHLEYLQDKRANDIREAQIPAQYLNLIPTPKIDVVRKVTKTRVKRIGGSK